MSDDIDYNVEENDLLTQLLSKSVKPLILNNKEKQKLAGIIVGTMRNGYENFGDKYVRVSKHLSKEKLKCR